MDDLNAPKTKALFLRVPIDMHDLIVEVASEQHKSMNVYCIEAIGAALEEDTSPVEPGNETTANLSPKVATDVAGVHSEV